MQGSSPLLDDPGEMEGVEVLEQGDLPANCALCLCRAPSLQVDIHDSCTQVTRTVAQLCESSLGTGPSALKTPAGLGTEKAF